MCFLSNRKIAAAILALVSCLTPVWSLAKQEGNPTIIWERIEGVTPVPNFTGQIIEGIMPVSFPWTLEHGRAQVNLANGKFEILLRGLAIGAMPTPLSPLGTTGVVTAVKGTLVCTGGGPVIDTDPEYLTETGDAFVRGKFANALDSCDPERLVFLLRVAQVLSGVPNITDFWLAYGASRRILAARP